MLRVVVDQDICQGHTLCAMAAPTIFELDDVEGHAHAVSEQVGADLEPLARRAQAACPEGAITVIAADDMRVR
jgi:ferredoxin